MGNIHVVTETTITAEKKSVVLVFLYLGSMSLKTRNMLRKLLKSIFICCKL